MSYLRKWLTVTLLVLILAALPTNSLAGEPDQEEPRVNITQVDSSDFPTVTVYVSITDQEGEPVGVEPERLVLKEDGIIVQPDQTQGLAESVQTLTTLLVFDVSGSMNHAGKLATAKEAARAYVEQMRPGDRVGLMTFNTEVDLVQPITSQRTALLAAIDALTAEEDTAMYDALAAAAEILQEVSGRKAIIVLTDGLDNRSVCSPEEVIAGIGPSGLSISTVGLGDPEVSDATNAGLDVQALQRLASQAGGEYAYANDSQSLTALYQRYARVLQSEYAITYLSPGGLRDGFTRNLTVTLSDMDSSAQGAAYNPGGLVPEVGDPAPWPHFLAILAGLVLLLFLPGILRSGFSRLNPGGQARKPRPRIRLKD